LKYAIRNITRKLKPCGILHALSHEVTFLLTGEAKAIFVLKFRLTVTRNKEQAIEPVGLVRVMQEKPGPWVLLPKTVAPDLVPKSEMLKVVIRNAAFLSYRKYFAQYDDNPRSIISALASKAAGPVAPLTGG